MTEESLGEMTSHWPKPKQQKLFARLRLTKFPLRIATPNAPDSGATYLGSFLSCDLRVFVCVPD